ncbi:hypothetical protein [Caballeronia sp. BR00000012568055]|uniref:COG4648 family protein n=1 Tax=Caballeronia sp. BR00000012568055 TaxID=2918761 RepID=UPI0023F6DEB5|nr:hypothetical protein [Caballeronia sp. BR00000012568055]
MSAAAVCRAALGVAAIAAYQIGAHHAVSTPGEHGLGLALVLVPVLLFALSAAARSPARVWLLPLWAIVCAALWFYRVPLTAHFGWGLYLEHVCFNLALAWMFGRTLAAGREPLVTQFARMVHGTLEPRIARYTRRVTVAWTAFFIGIALVSTALFALASIVTWSTFANYLALPLVAVMFIGEYACRRIALPGVQQSGILDSVRAYTNSTQ